MSDIVKRLRAIPSREVIGLTHRLAKEAADEIKRLRALVKELTEKPQ